MKQVTRALFALAAGLVFAGCGGSDADQFGGTATSYIVDGVENPCDPIDERERALMSAPGWRPACRKFDRMGNVELGSLGFTEPGWEEADAQLALDNAAHSDGADYGSSSQAITFGTGQGMSVNLNADGKILSWNGACHPRAGTGSIVDHCIVPEKVNFLWEVCPDQICGTAVNKAFIRSRFREAWDVWRNAIPGGSCAGQGVIPTADNARSFFNLGPCGTAPGATRPCGNENVLAYDRSTLPIFFEDVLEQGTFAGRTTIFGRVKQFSQVVNRTQYYSYSAAGIVVDDITISDLEFLCGVTVPQLGLTDFQRADAHGYTRMLAHELGHVRGLPHLSTGLMRPGTKHSCSETFAVPGPPASSAIGSTVAKANIVVGNVGAATAIQKMRDSTGVNLFTSPSQCDTATSVPDAANVADFSTAN